MSYAQNLRAFCPAPQYSWGVRQHRSFYKPVNKRGKDDLRLPSYHYVNRGTALKYILGADACVRASSDDCKVLVLAIYIAEQSVNLPAHASEILRVYDVTKSPMAAGFIVFMTCKVFS